MKKLKKLKIIIIAAGIMLSAAFYVLGGSAGEALRGGGDSLIIGGAASDELQDTSRPVADTAERAAADNAEQYTSQQDASQQSALQEYYSQRLEYELYIGADGRGYISDALKDELKNCIRSAVRDELIALCEEGYIEQAVSEAAGYAAAEAERRAGMVNINTADAAELMTLDGIGEKRANDIIAYRDAHGAFNTIEDIMQVSGIKQSSYDKIKDKIYT